MTNSRLRELCIENNWLPHCDDDQYAKLLILNSDCASIEEIACVIWACGYSFDRSDIVNTLRVEELPCIGISHLIDTLRRCQWGEWEIEQICLAVSNSSLCGTEYKII